MADKPCDFEYVREATAQEAPACIVAEGTPPPRMYCVCTLPLGHGGAHASEDASLVSAEHLRQTRRRHAEARK